MTPEPAPQRKRMSELSRIIGVFFSPKETFADVLERPRWIIPVILLTICVLAFVALYAQHIGWEQIVRQQMEQSPRTQQMTPEQRDQAVAIGVKFGSVVGYIQAAIAPLLGVLIVGAALMFVANAILGTQLKYKQMLGITSYAFLTGLVSTPLMILVMFLKNKEDFDIRNPLAFNLGAFLSAESPKWLQSLLSSFDLFSFWTMSLLAIGIAAAGRKLTFGKALMAVIIPWAVWVILKTAATALFS